jgi:hypothetical protein
MGVCVCVCVGFSNVYSEAGDTLSVKRVVARRLDRGCIVIRTVGDRYEEGEAIFCAVDGVAFIDHE